MGDEWDGQLSAAYKQHFGGISAQKSTLREYAPVIRADLVERAKNGDPEQADRGRSQRGTTTYGATADLVGTSSQYVWRVLGIIDLVGQRLNEPPLSPLVERSGLMGPGRGYFVWDFVDYPRERINTDAESALSDYMKKEWKNNLRETYEYDGWTEWNRPE